MKKVLVLLLTAILCITGLISCGKETESGVASVTTETVLAFNEVSLNGKIISIPCTVQEMLNEVGSASVNEEELDKTIEPGGVATCSIFQNGCFSFAVRNMADSPVSVKDGYIVSAGFALSFKELTFDFEAEFPGGVKYGEAFDEEKICNLLGIDLATADDHSDGSFDMEFTENGNQYFYGVGIKDGNVLLADIRLSPSSDFFKKEVAGEQAETIEEDVVEDGATPEQAAAKEIVENFVKGAIKSTSTVTFSINGTELPYPSKVRDVLVASGVDINSGDYAYNVGSDLESIPISRDVEITAYNPNDFEEVSVLDCWVISIFSSDIYGDVVPDIVFPGNLSYGNTIDMESVIELLGEPSEITPGTFETTYSYSDVLYNGSERPVFSMEFEITTENQLASARMKHPSDFFYHFKGDEGEKIYYIKMLEAGPYKEEIIDKYCESTGADVSIAEAVLECGPAVIWKTTDVNMAKVFQDALRGLGCIMDEDMTSSEISAEESIEEETAESIVEESADENQTYYIKMLDVGPRKVLAIKAYRDNTGTDLSTAKDAVESAPAVIWETTDADAAQALLDALKEAGATMDEDMTSGEVNMD